MTTPGLGMVEGVGLSGMSAPVDSGLLQKVWETQVSSEKVLHDPMVSSMSKASAVMPANKEVLQAPANTLMMNMSKAGNPGARSVTKAFAEALSGTGRFGSNSVMKYEETRQLRWASAYSGDWGHAVALQSYGLNARELSPYKIKEATKNDLAKWQGEFEGRCIREALIEGRSRNVAAAPLSLAQPLNPNVHFVNQLSSLQPATICEDTSRTGGVATSMQTAVGVAAKAITGSTCHLTVAGISAASKVARLTKYITPINIAGKVGYILWAHPDEILRLRSSTVDDSVAKLAITAAVPQEVNELLPGYAFFVDNVFVVEDPRAATMTIAGNSTSGYTSSIGYMGMGKVDGRTSAIVANTDFNINILTGENPLFYYETEAPHYENQLDDYHKDDNVAYIGAMGYSRVDWNYDTNSEAYSHPTRGTIHTVFNEGSMLWVTQRA